MRVDELLYIILVIPARLAALVVGSHHRTESRLIIVCSCREDFVQIKREIAVCEHAANDAALLIAKNIIL